MTDYYDWTALPRHRYCDSFWIDMNPQLITVSPQSELNDFALYDRKAASGTAAYRVGFLQRLGGITTGNMTPQIEYRLLGGTAIHQRGFFAFNTQLPAIEKGMEIELVANYTHQKRRSGKNSLRGTNIPIFPSRFTTASRT